MQQSIMSQGADLMLYGMGAVFVFLTLLVFFTIFMSWAVNRFFPEDEQPMTEPAPMQPAAIAAVEPKVLAVIQRAITEHRTKQGL